MGIHKSVLYRSLDAACQTVSYAKMLTVLFVGVRIRALQITEGKGDPQDWAQSAMLMCSYAVVVQTVLVLGIPVFSGGEAQEDAAKKSTADHAIAGLLSLI